MTALIERLANLGYGLLGLQTDKDVAVTPSVQFSFYDDTMGTMVNLDEDSPIVGQRMKIYQEFMGLRTHEGVLNVLAEPNTAEHFFAMMLKPGSPSGGGPYTHPFTLDIPTKAYTLDLLKGQLVERYWGVEAQSIEPSWDKDKMQFNVDVSARGSFIVREIASIDTVNVTLKTNYDPKPTKGLVTSDLIRVMKADGSTTLDTTVSSITDDTTVVLGASAASYAAGDLLFLRAQTPSLTVKTPFLWARTEFRFGADAATALSATQTNVEQGSKWKLMHSFEKKGGADRSGSFDPLAFPRTTGETSVNAKLFFDQPQDLNRFLTVAARALVIRHFSETGYELRITLNSLIQKTNKRPLKTGGIIYQEMDYDATYNVSDGAGMAVTVINNLAA